MSHSSNTNLINFLTDCEEEVLLTLMKMMDTFFSQKVKVFKIYKSTEDIPEKNSIYRKKLSTDIVNQLSYFGSNSYAYAYRKIIKKSPGVSYSEILYDVLKLLKKQLEVKTDIPRIASVEYYERLVCDLLLKNEFKNKTDEEIAQMLEEAGLDKETATEKAKEFSKLGIAGVSIVSLVKYVGKKTVTEIIEKILFSVAAKKLGKDVAEKLVQKILKKTTQKAFSRLLGAVGYALLAYDFINLGNSASRITVPCIAFISTVRTIDRLNEDKN